MGGLKGGGGLAFPAVSQQQPPAALQPHLGGFVTATSYLPNIPVKNGGAVGIPHIDSTMLVCLIWGRDREGRVRPVAPAWGSLCGWVIRRAVCAWDWGRSPAPSYQPTAGHARSKAQRHPGPGAASHKATGRFLNLLPKLGRAATPPPRLTDVFIAGLGGPEAGVSE